MNLNSTYLNIAAKNQVDEHIDNAACLERGVIFNRFRAKLPMRGIEVLSLGQRRDLNEQRATGGRKALKFSCFWRQLF